MNIDVIALQEPAIINTSCSIAAREWISVYPTLHLNNPKKTQLLLLIQVQISMDSWNQLVKASTGLDSTTCTKR